MSPYRSFQYLEAGKDYRDFELAPDVDRVPAYLVPLTKEEEARADALMARHTIVSLHDHTSIFPARTEDFFAQRRQGRDATGYAGLARSGTDVFFEAFMDGTATITSNAGWKWTDIIHDLGMRLSDIAHQDSVFVATTLEDLRRAKAEGRIAFVIALEAATMIENEVDRVDVLYGLGVRCMGITYSEANALGSGLKEERDGGLTELGRQVVRRMDRLGMAIDVAHVGDRTSLDVIEASEHPIFITHAGARALWDTPRMKPDEVIRACAAKGGVIGVEAAPHTTLTKAHPEHSIDSVMEHVAYCVDLVGADHVALGPDTLLGDHVGLHKAFAQQLSIGKIHRLPYKEVPYVKGMENPGESMRNAVRWLVAHGYGDGDIAKIAGGNVLRVLEAVWAR
ncbi:MAG TPA: membrane dipeptidase [Candidatus Limnocylindria bacterium]|nr:membrane dipeptidase [Candidatus Limnocylindria bacterium]